jgi:hypothetical protein
MRALRGAGSDVVFLALLGSSAVAILMACLLGLLGLTKNWDRDVLGQPLFLRGGIAQTMTREDEPQSSTQINWQIQPELRGSIRMD